MRAGVFLIDMKKNLQYYCFKMEITVQMEEEMLIKQIYLKLSLYLKSFPESQLRKTIRE
jgi:hypothetical protein